MILRSIITFSLSLFYLLSVSAQNGTISDNPVPEKYAIVKLFLDSPIQLNEMAMEEIDFDHIHGDLEDGIQLHLTHKDVEKLNNLEIKYEILVEDYHKYYEKRQAKAMANLPDAANSKTAANFGYGSMGGFYTLSEIEAKLDEMHSLFPSITTAKYSIGTTTEGRPIWALKISDNPNVDEPESVAYYDALHHAREPLSMAATVNYMFWLLENYGTDPAVTYIIDNRELYFVPVVNPDGYEYNRSTNPNGGGLWRKNRRGGYGVDLNRNYSYQWGFNNSCASNDTNSSTYRGAAPFSEPEAAAVRDFVAQISPTVAFSTHATAGSFLMPYGYNSTPPDFPTYAEWASDFLAENDYPYGTTSQMLGYTSCGTTRDYLHTEGIYAWTPEIDGSGFWPATSEIFALVDENIFPMFYQAWISGGYADVQSHTVVGSAEAGSNFELEVELKNKGAGNVTTNTVVQLIPSNSQITVSGPISYGTIAARAKKDNTGNLFNITLDPAYNLGSVDLDIVVSQDGVESKRESISIPVGTKTTIFSDDAESGTGKWNDSGNGISWGTNFDDSYSGNRSFADSDGSNFINNTLNYFTTVNSINLNNTTNPYLEFFAKWSFEPGDFANLQISTNNGSSWTSLKTYTAAEAWTQEQFSLADYIGDNVMLRFRMISDNSLNTDGFYFDDIEVSEYYCPNCPICFSAVSSFPYNESFETNASDWTQAISDDIDWTRNSGGTPSNNTGPTSASDGNFYMYTEATDPNHPAKSAYLESPCFDLTNASSADFMFDYNMFGAAMGTLSFDVSIDNGTTWTNNIWTISGNQNQGWNSQSFDLQNFLGEFVKIRARGITGTSWTSDIAIDNISITAMTCLGQPCDDGDACTTGETYDANCGCSGGIVQDADNDGVCDADDVCPNFDDNLIGTTCDDGDACTTGETYDANCGCSGGIVEDSDNDGICDALDECPNDSSNSCNSVQTCASTGTNTTYEYIDAVQIENLINRSGNNSGYSNFTALSANVIGGETYNVTLTPGFEIQPYIEHWAIAVDLDGNGNFNGAEEVLLRFSSNSAETHPITIPTGYNGAFLMRIAMQYNSPPPLCGNFTYGEVEDYTLVINNGSCTVGVPCNDNNPCTTDDVIDAACNCTGIPIADSDGDGICDTEDSCPSLDDSLIGTACDDGDSCTTGETYDRNCECSGGISVDSDEDGICDALDTCSTIDDNLIGTPCDDNDDCTMNDIYTTNCDCAGTATMDADNDGICDANDICPNFDDNLIGTTCEDGDDCTTGETYDANCGCSGGTFADQDEDGICDTLDECTGFDDNMDINNNGIPDGCELSCQAINFLENPVLSYDQTQDLGNFEIQDGGTTLYIENNSWKAIDISYEVTTNTVITFDFKSTIEGEIHEVSFDNNLQLSPLHRLVIYGNQGFSGNHSVETYTTISEWQSFSIALGKLFTGDFQYLVLTADDDNKVEGTSFFRNVTMFEDTNGDLSCDNDCIPGTSCDDGNPCTIGETYDSLCGCNGGVIINDADDDGVCDDFDLCPNFDDNLIGSSCDDNDNCTIGETYDTECGCTGGVFVDSDNDGFCANEDPDDNDSCIPNDEGCSDCEEFDFNDFENSYGIWNQGGGDCSRSSNFSSFATSGTTAVRIRDNSGIGSSMFSDVLDMSSYQGVDISFSFIPNSMEANEDFFLEVSSDAGVSFSIVEEWNSGIEMINNVRQDVTVNIPETLLSTTTVFRIRCDASTNSDRVYLDDVLIETCGSSASAKTQKLQQETEVVIREAESTGSLIVYPNPAYNELFIALGESKYGILSNAKIITALGQVVKDFHFDQKDKSGNLDISDLSPGQTYLIIVESKDGTNYIEKFVKI